MLLLARVMMIKYATYMNQCYIPVVITKCDKEDPGYDDGQCRPSSDVVAKAAQEAQPLIS
jgi:hypothetical protein